MSKKDQNGWKYKQFFLIWWEYMQKSPEILLFHTFSSP